MITRPMLAEVVAPKQLDSLPYPQAVSIKYDGIRCLIHPTLGPVSRSFKPIPNIRVRDFLSEVDTELDGELLIFKLKLDGTKEYLPYNPVQSFVMSALKTLPHNYDMEFVVFDNFTYPEDAYRDRLRMMNNRTPHPKVTSVHQEICWNAPEILEFYEKCLADGHEGVMIRSLESPYKSGRSTRREGHLLKMKPIHQDEGTIVAGVALETNENEAQQDMFGLTERSSHKAGKRQKELLGAFVVKTSQWGEIRLGSGFTAVQRARFWRDREQLIGWTVSFKYQAVGVKDKPRFPRFVKLVG